MTRDVYTQAFLKALKETSAEEALKGLREALTSRGHMSLYPRILKDAKVALSKEEKESKAYVTLARKEDEATYKQQIESFVGETGMRGFEISVDPGIIGGFVAKTKNISRDQSFKGSLLSMYRSLTK